MSNSEIQSPNNIDRGSHRIPDSVKRQAELLAAAKKSKPEKLMVSYAAEEDPIESINTPAPIKSTTVKTEPALPIDKFTTEFIRSYPKESEDVIRWYSGIKNSRNNKNKLMLGIAGFPVKVRVNPLLIRNEDNYLTVFVKSDNSLEISLPVASEVVLDGEIDGEAFTNKLGMFLGEINFDKNFLFKILIFVVK